MAKLEFAWRRPAGTTAWAVAALLLLRCNAENVPAARDDSGAAPSVDGGDAGGGAQLAALAPEGVDFGDVDVGQQSASVAAVVANEGQAPCATLSTAIVGPGATAMGIDRDGCAGQTLLAGARCAVYLHFAPTIAGPAMADLAVRDAAGLTVLVPLAGVGDAAGSLTAAVSSLDFGAVATGATSSPQTVVFTNAGPLTSPLAVAVTGAEGGDFPVSQDGCSGQSLPTGGSCSVAVAFAPTASMPSDETASLTVGSGQQTATVSLSGAASASASLAIAPAAFDFGNVAIGAQAALEQFTVTNTGGVATGIPDVSVGGANSNDFVVTSNGCAMPIAPSASCTVGVVFSPTTAAAESASLALDAGNATATATFTGTGLAPAALVLSPTSQSFSSTTQGAASPPATFTVQNRGGTPTGPLTIGIGGTGGNQFRIDADGCTAMMLGVGKTCSIVVHFAPTAGTLGATSASLDVSGSPGGQAAAELTGVAIAPAALAISSDDQGFGTVVWGSSATAPFTLKNSGGASTGPVTVGLTGTGAAAFSLSGNTCASAMLPGGGTCSVTVVFSPTSGTGAETATLQATASPGGTVQAALTGTAQKPAALSIAPPSGFSGFGTVAYGTTSTGASFTVSNGGGQTTGAIAVSLGGSNASQFVVESDACSHATLAPEQSCVVTVAFSPTGKTTGAQQATLTASASPGGSAPASLGGTAAAPASLALSAPSGFSGFGTVLPPGSSSAAVFTVTNGGGVASGSVAIAIAGTNASEFSTSKDGCTGRAIDPGKSCTVSVTFTPSSSDSGAQSATLTASATPGGSPSYKLTGTVGTPAELAIAAPSGFSGFGTVVDGATSSSATFTVSNGGTQTSGALAVSLSGAGASQFALASDGCTGNTLASQQTCVVSVVFDPASGTSGSEQATLAVSATPGGSPTASLTGTAATPAALAWAAPSGFSGFGTVIPPATSAAQVFTLSNGGGVATGSIAVTVTGAGQSAFVLSSDGCTGQELGAGQTCSVSVTFAPGPSATGSEQAALTATASPGGSASMAVAGSVGSPPPDAGAAGEGDATLPPTASDAGGAGSGESDDPPGPDDGSAE